MIDWFTDCNLGDHDDHGNHDDQPDHDDHLDHDAESISLNKKLELSDQTLVTRCNRSELQHHESVRHGICQKFYTARYSG